MPRPTTDKADVILVGGGLANSLIALALKARDPALDIRLLERSPERDRLHTWSVFETDLSPMSAARLLPLAAARWSGYGVRFPEVVRTLGTPYASFSGEGIGVAVEQALGDGVLRGSDVASLSPASVTLTCGRTLSAALIVDGRGARRSPHLRLAWQKFVGLEVRTASPHGVERPMVMDATVAQKDGYRFLYVLPLSADTLLIEDTRYSDGPALDVPDLEGEIAAYAQAQAWTIVEVLRQEEGVLPLSLGGDIEAFLAEGEPGLPAVGMRAALFHPTTGYSLPDAAALAEVIAAAPELTSSAISRRVRDHAVQRWRERGFFRALNRMMFLAAEPQDRYRILQRFYRLPQPLIERFYAGHPTWGDRLRILSGKPPVPVGRALQALAPSATGKGERAHA